MPPFSSLIITPFHSPMELLAPAGSFPAFEAALEAKADAIYVGAPGFNARALSRDFTFAEIGSMIEQAHKSSVKVYIAMNSLVKEAALQNGLFSLHGGKNTTFFYKEMSTMRAWLSTALLIVNSVVFSGSAVAKPLAHASSRRHEKLIKTAQVTDDGRNVVIVYTDKTNQKIKLDKRDGGFSDLQLSPDRKAAAWLTVAQGCIEEDGNISEKDFNHCRGQVLERSVLHLFRNGRVVDRIDGIIIDPFMFLNNGEQLVYRSVAMHGLADYHLYDLANPKNAAHYNELEEKESYPAWAKELEALERK